LLGTGSTGTNLRVAGMHGPTLGGSVTSISQKLQGV
jgi:hypothetical protein